MCVPFHIIDNVARLEAEAMRQLVVIRRKTATDNQKGGVTPGVSSVAVYAHVTQIDGNMGESMQAVEEVSLNRWSVTVEPTVIVKPTDELIINAVVTLDEGGSYVSHTGGQIVMLENVLDLDSERTINELVCVEYKRKG